MDLAVIKGTMPKRRVSKKELKAPDEVQTRLSKVVNFLLAHRHWVATGLISVILIGSGTYLWQRQRMKREEASSWMLSQALREEGEKTRRELTTVIREESKKTREELGAKIDNVGNIVKEESEKTREVIKEEGEKTRGTFSERFIKLEEEVARIKEALIKAGIM